VSHVQKHTSDNVAVNVTKMPPDPKQDFNEQVDPKWIVGERFEI
jgi:hypothetical protein